jgi:hypothetical protein
LLQKKCLHPKKKKKKARNEQIEQENNEKEQNNANPNKQHGNTIEVVNLSSF